MDSASLIKEQNLHKVREALSSYEKLSKRDLTNKTNLSFPTITRLINELVTNNEVIETMDKESTGGRNATLYSINHDYALYLLIAIEGYKVTWSINNLNNAEAARGEFEYADQGLLTALDAFIVDYERKYPNIKRIAIGFSAMIERGKIKEIAWAGWNNVQGVDLIMHFSTVTSIPVMIDNDMNIVALGQWHCSTIESRATATIYRNFSGFGCGLTMNGEVWRGANGVAGEVSIFLPGLKHLLRKPETEYTSEDVIDAYCIIIQSYVALLNIKQVVLYENDIIKNRIEEIRNRCYSNLIEDIIPNIEISNEFEKHYQIGLFYLAHKGK